MSFTTVEEIFKYIESFMNLERNQTFTAQKYNLDRMYKLCNIFENPQNSFSSIHVAGSKGKGSTAAFVASILNANGLKTGLYTSPHVSSYKERISLAGTFFNDKQYIEAAHELFDNIKPDNYTTFELLTILSFIIFRKANCEWAVFETGLGGRLDATNVILPKASIITIIELEHTDILGKTIKEIATEKAGIIKKGIPVFCAHQDKIAKDVFKQRAKQLSCPLFFLDEVISNIENIEPSKGFFQAANIKTKDQNIHRIEVKTPGIFQIENATLAFCCLDYISKNKDNLLPDNFIAKKGIGSIKLPGRCEIITKKITNNKEIKLFLDGAHTVTSVKASANAFFETLGKDTVNHVLIFGAVTGKDFFAMAKILLPIFSNIIISKPGNFKKNNPKDVFEVFKKNSQFENNIQLIETPKEALSAACQYDAPIFVTGSFYMVAEIRKLLF